MTLPDDARLEAQVAGGVRLYDVSALLPGDGYPERDVERIERVYVHHSGALGRPGYEGALASARYAVGGEWQGEQWGRGWPGAPYHGWIPYEPCRDRRGHYVILRLQPDAARCYHTGGPANGHGWGLALQGDLTESGPSAFQIECLEALLPWLRSRFPGLDDDTWLSWHSESDRWGGSGKPTCPGPPTVEWLHQYRSRSLPWCPPEETT